MRSVSICLFLLSLLLAGCGGNTDPVNEGKDRPIPLKKAQEKDK